MPYEKGQALRGGIARLREAQTTPPPRYTEGSLITAMTNIHRHITDEDDRKVLRDTEGLGTGRTRGPTIDNLKAKKYLVVRVSGKRKELHPTDLAMELIPNLPSGLADPVMTAKWEMALRLIAQGKMQKQQFTRMIADYVGKFVEQMKGVKLDVEKLGLSESTPRAGTSGQSSGKAPPEVDDTVPGHGRACEKCGKASMKGVRFASGKRKLSCTGFPQCKNEQWVD